MIELESGARISGGDALSRTGQDDGGVMCEGSDNNRKQSKNVMLAGPKRSLVTVEGERE